ISSGSSFSGSFTVPAETPVGNYRLRVRAVESTTTFTACSSQTWGETEDYSIEVLPAPACLPPSALTATNLTTNSADLGWTSDGNVFEIKWGAPGFDVETEGTLVEDFESGATLSGLDPNTTYQFYVRQNCGTEESDWA